MGHASRSDEQGQKSRDAKRLRVSMIGLFGSTGAKKSRVNVFDLSTTGFRIATFQGVHKDVMVWLTLPNLGPQPARVMWIKGGFVGCRFERPLHEAVVEMMAGKASDA